MSAVTDAVLLSFVDTNVLVYAFDVSDRRRWGIANHLIENLVDRNELCTSTQVLGEFFITVTRKIRVPISTVAARQAMDAFAEWPVVASDYQLVRDACELSTAANISYWDALIVAAAVRAGATRLYTEDLNAGQKLLGVEIVNPFATV